MFSNGSPIAWKIMIHVMIMCITVASIVAAMRFRLTRNRNFDSYEDGAGLSNAFPDAGPAANEP